MATMNSFGLPLLPPPPPPPTTTILGGASVASSHQNNNNNSNSNNNAANSSASKAFDLSTDALFACTRCNARHRFEDLSEGMMFCDRCRDLFVNVKCTYCRVEFQQEKRSDLNPICVKCAASVQKYGKPSACEYCNMIAAFIGTKCQRCTHSERKYGTPLSCEQCKGKCAFDRRKLEPDSVKRLDGKMLCWTCTMDYRKGQNRNKEAAAAINSITNRHAHKRDHSSSGAAYRSGDHANRNGGAGSAWGSSKKSRVSSSTSSSVPTSTTATSSTSSSTLPGTNSSSGPGSGAPGSLPGISSSDSDLINASDNVVEIAQLREKLIAADKQMKAKNAELLKKDVRITELKSEISKEQRDCREKLQEMQKRHHERLQELQSKITTLTKQVASLQKAGKKGGGGGADSSLF